MKRNYFAVGKIQNALECAYAAGWRAMQIAKKLKNEFKRKSARARIMGNINRIRGELSRLIKSKWAAHESVAYSGVIFDLLDRPIIHSRFLRAA